MLIVFGGSFDPVHRGHLAMADAAQRELSPTRILWLLSRHAPHKPGKPPAAASVRLALLHAVVDARPGEEICTLELEREGPSYTVETLRLLQQEHADAEFGFLLGADSLSHLHTWRDLPELFRRVQFLLVAREGWGASSLEEFRASLSAELRTLFRARFLPMDVVSASSTAIRADLERGCMSEGIPSVVADLIRVGECYGFRGTDR